MTVMISLFSPVRYSAEATVMASGFGFTVTVADCGAEARLAVLVAVTVTVIVVGVNWVNGKAGAVKLMVAAVGGF